MTKIIISILVTLTFSLTASAYDQAKAESFNKFYSNFTHNACANSKLFIEAEEVIQKIVKKESYVLLDVRTKAEKSIAAISEKNSLDIELKDLFKKENLDKLPKDKTIFLVCHSGTRAVLAAPGLLQLGFKNIHIVKGGFVAIANAANPKNTFTK
ncbi:rhodanese-like domain-containing protein [Sulfurimonas sp.]|uniref:rhodanese-like domain-containing protein n=1 Tax=Sulfurimonas sp. TaxID=2022749 RepID=UPI003563B29F